MQVLGCLLILVPSLLAGQAEGPQAGAAASITSHDIARRIAIVAADSMMGRGNPSPGLERTAEYVIAEFRRLGLRPGGDQGTYVQRFGLTRWTIDSIRSAVILKSPRAKEQLSIGSEARYIDGSMPDAPLRGEVVLLSRPAALSSQLKDKVVLLVLDYAKPLPATLGQEIYSLAAGGPRAVLLLSNRDSITFADRLRAARHPRFQLDSAAAGDTVAPIIEIHERTLGSLLSAVEVDLDRLRRRPLQEPRALSGLTAEVRLNRRVLSRARLPNVVGILDGADSELRGEYVAYSAHIDHIGLSPGQPDSINNGADDNASGVAGLLELAEAFSRPGMRPRRSLLFFAPSAEEPGLLGSAYFTDHPTVPLASIVADINMDLIGRNWPDSVIAVGIEQSDLGSVLDRVTQAHPELRMTPIADRWPEERIFYRSDHYNFARRGVPILFFTSGTHADYHRPSDELGRIDSEKASRLVRLLFHLGQEVANRPNRPSWKAESYRQIVERR
jgi:Peptidase family M28